MCTMLSGHATHSGGWCNVLLRDKALQYRDEARPMMCRRHVRKFAHYHENSLHGRHPTLVPSRIGLCIMQESCFTPRRVLRGICMRCFPAAGPASTTTTTRNAVGTGVTAVLARAKVWRCLCCCCSCCWPRSYSFCVCTRGSLMNVIALVDVFSSKPS